jgi:hypothetical protein
MDDLDSFFEWRPATVALPDATKESTKEEPTAVKEDQVHAEAERR